MKPFLKIFFSISAVSSISQAECIKERLKDVTSHFKVVSVSDARMVCDDQASKDNQVMIKEPGCVIKLQILKNELKAQSVESDGIYQIYEIGGICSLQVGSEIRLKLSDIRSECCKKFGENGMYGYKTCTTKPSLKHISQPPEEYIRCNLNGVSWKSDSNNSLSKNCDGVNRNLTDSEKVKVAPIIALQLKKELPAVTDVEVLKKFTFKKWTIYKVNSKVSDEPFVFFNGEPSVTTYVGNWSGVATVDETQEIFKWTTENMKGVPKELAQCFAWHVTKERK